VKRAAALLALAVALVPGLAAACATCVSSAFGDRTYNWPYLALILMPFVVVGAIGAVVYRYRGALQSPPPLEAPLAVDSLLDKETT
jgi:hypothetical protein